MTNIIRNGISKLLYGFFFALGLVPRRLSFFLSYLFGNAWYLIDKRHRSIVLENLSQAFSHEKRHTAIERIARRVFMNLSLIPFEIGWSLRLSKNDFMRHCEVIGHSNWIKAQSKEKGVFILTAHIGNWELLPSIFSSYNLPASFVYRPLDFKPADLFFLRIPFPQWLYPDR